MSVDAADPHSSPVEISRTLEAALQSLRQARGERRLSNGGRQHRPLLIRPLLVLPAYDGTRWTRSRRRHKHRRTHDRAASGNAAAVHSTRSGSSPLISPTLGVFSCPAVVLPIGRLLTLGLCIGRKHLRHIAHDCVKAAAAGRTALRTRCRSSGVVVFFSSYRAQSGDHCASAALDLWCTSYQATVVVQLFNAVLRWRRR